jgi:hypothetical protein
MAAGTKKVTVHLSGDLLQRAQRSTGKGVTDTIRVGLRLVAAGETYRKIQRLRGKVKFSAKFRTLREDRS